MHFEHTACFLAPKEVQVNSRVGQVIGLGADVEADDVAVLGLVQHESLLGTQLSLTLVAHLLNFDQCVLGKLYAMEQSLI